MRHTVNQELSGVSKLDLSVAQVTVAVAPYVARQKRERERELKKPGIFLGKEIDF